MSTQNRGFAQADSDAEATEVVVLKDLTYRPHTDRALDPAMHRYLPAERGNRIKVRSGDELDRLVQLGAVTTDVEGRDAQLAGAGVADRGQVGAATIPSEAQQVRAIQSAHGFSGLAAGPQSQPWELAKLDTTTLQQVALAFGVPYSKDDSRESLVEKLVKLDEDFQATVQHRDQVQVAGRESGGETGRLGGNVLDKGRDATTGERLDTTETSDTSDASKSDKSKTADKSK